MFQTTEQNLTQHLKHDLGIQPNDLVFLFSGIFGLGKLQNGLSTLENAISSVLPRGTLIVPTFSYSWSNGESFDKNTPCPEMGSFSNYVLTLPNYHRTNNPNFSVSIRENDFNSKLVKSFLDISNDCFGEGSIFDKVVRYAENRRAWILLLGGAFKDAEYRSTFIHYAQQKVGVMHRYVKTFHAPDNSNAQVTQLVRCLSKDELVENKETSDRSKFKFPVEEDYRMYGKDLIKAGLLKKEDFGYYPSRMVSVKDSVSFYMNKIKEDPYYCIDKNSLIT